MQENITIPNNDGQKLSAVLQTPEIKTNKVIILTHSFKADKDIDTILVNLSKRLCDLGYATLRYDVYGFGESDGTTVETTVKSELEDLKAVIAYAKERYHTIGLGGLSLGAAISMIAAREAKCLILFSIAYDLNILYERYKDMFEKTDVMEGINSKTQEKVLIGKQMWLEFDSIDLKEYAREVNCPALVVSASDDKIITPIGQMGFSRLFKGEVETHVIKDCDHDFLDPNKEEEAISYAIGFVKKWF